MSLWRARYGIPRSRHVRGRHSHLRCFAKPSLGLRDRPDLTAKSNFAEEDRVELATGRSYTLDASALATARSPAGSCNPHSADDIQKNIELRERKTGALVEHSEKERETTSVETGC